jgi:hypothetical protein
MWQKLPSVGLLRQKSLTGSRHDPPFIAASAYRRAYSGQKVGLRHAQMLRIFRVLAPTPRRPALMSLAGDSDSLDLYQ